MNAKSIKRFLPLSGEISMSKNHSVPNDNWDEVEDNNSPIHNDALCPLFYTETKTENPSITDKYGNIYTTSNDFLTKNGKNLFEVENSIFTKQEIEADLSTFYNNEIYRAYHSGSSVIIEKSSDGITFEHYNTVVNSSFAINVIERLWHGHYVALTLYNGRTSIIFDNNIQYLSNDTNWLTDTESPIMTLTEYSDSNYLIYISNKSGAVLHANGYASEALVTKLLTFNETDGFTEVTNKTWTGNIDVPASSQSIALEAGTAQITKSDVGSETRICYKQDNKYYDLDSAEELTFSPGYTPIATSTENQYRYTVYTTNYHYDYDITSNLQDWGTATPAATVYFNVNLNSANQPIISSSWDYTLPITEWTSDNILSFDITLKNNYGYITSADLINFNPVVKVHHESAVDRKDMTFTVPAEYTSVSGMGQYNRTVSGNSPWAEWDYSVTSSTVPATFWSGTHLYMPDDSEYIYPFYATNAGSTESSTFVGYNNKATYSVTAADAINFTAVRMDKCGTSYGGYQIASSVSIGYGYFRHTFLTKTENTPFEDDVYTGGIFKTYDMVADIMLANTGAYRTSTVWNETRKVNAFYLPTGTKANVTDRFTPLFNNGFISGISYNSTLVTPWLSIDTAVPFYTDDNVVYYRDVDTGKWILVKKEEAPVQLSLVENRYLVLNTTSYWNCYDTKLNKINKYAYDWNNRIFFGRPENRDFSGTLRNWIHGSGANVSYSVVNKNSGVSSAVFAAYVLTNGTSTKYFPTDEKVDIEEYEISYSTSTSVAPTYYRTFHNIVRGVESSQLKYNDSDLSYYKAVYPLYSGTSMMRNPSIFAKWSLSGNNQDYMIDGDNGFQVLYEDTEPMLLTSTSGSIKGMESIFVIQSMPYAVLDGKIYSLSYLNGVYQGRDCIININGMKYIGAVPSRAYFYSPNNRAIYIFTGDANLTKAKDASAISDIYYITSNPATQTIYMATNDGLYMISDRHSFKQTFYDVQSITFIEDGTVAICHKQESYTNTRFYYEDADGRTTNKVRYNSGLLGAGEHRVFTIDKYNISLFSDQKRNGALKVKSYILLDNGQIQEEESPIKVNKTDWDNIFYSKQVDFTPKYNKGVGVGIMIESDFAISNITASCTVEPATNPSGTRWAI